MAPILTEDELYESVSQWRRAGLRIGFTCGAFDLLHAGHVDYLERARALCDRLVVAVNSDASIRTYKDPRRPIIAENFRMKVIAALSCVDAVTLLTESRPASLIELLKPDFYIKGGDYNTSQLSSAPLVESYGGQCVAIPVEHEISTTKVIERVEQFLLHAPPEQMKRTSAAGLILLDRDGTLIDNVSFLKDPSRVRLLPGVPEGLKELQDYGFVLAIVTNQQGLGLGYFSYDEFVAVNSAMFRELSKAGVRISRIFYCPHSFADGCECRKPGTKLVLDALSYFDADAGQCFMIGDSKDDVIAAQSAGCRGILLSSEGQVDTSSLTRVPDFQSAVSFILSASLASHHF
ncbi:MAG: HAD-IIIA family hydrolase [Acidobacteriota bacterium]|nr:HAD-IIIA family hydrolase [Acidobacteriota bacterium]